jgi:hypothetical protein
MWRQLADAVADARRIVERIEGIVWKASMTFRNLSQDGFCKKWQSRGRKIDRRLR